MIETAIHEEVSIPVGNVVLPGYVQVPQHASSLVIFSHGSGSSRFSPRNQFVADILQLQGIGTLLFDLLVKDEDTPGNRFDLEMLTTRLIAATEWMLDQPYASQLGVGYFGASTGAACALNAAARMGQQIMAVVSRGGRPDLALPLLPQVKAATLLIVGGHDSHVMQLNRTAYNKLKEPKELHIIPEASHLFEEPGKLEQVADLAAHWFSRYLIEAVV